MATVLEATNLRVQYGTYVAVPDLNLQLSGGHLLGLIGPNGAGKTTTLKALAGLLPRSAGSVKVLGQEVEPGRPEALSRIGFAPDTPALYDDLSVSDFLRFVGRSYRVALDAVEERIDFWLEQLWLADRHNAKIKSLSRGMRQRLIIARTLLPDPTLVLLDEPAAGLDPAGRVQFRQLLGNLRDQGKALIVSSHILADLDEYCTHIAIMHGGKVIQFGTVAQVVGGKADNRCRYIMTLAMATPGTAQLLEQIPAVTQVQVDGRRVSFEFEHEAGAAADLLRTLLNRGLPVASFAPEAQDLEQAYLRTGIKQVD
jgi:ABC-2 type transport system ATP-binding protein